MVGDILIFNALCFDTKNRIIKPKNGYLSWSIGGQSNSFDAVYSNEVFVGVSTSGIKIASHTIKPHSPTAATYYCGTSDSPFDYGYFKNIPKEMVSAALIDGCSHTAAFWKVVFPSALPGFVAVGALSFLLAWDEFMYALIFTNTDSAKTIPVAISEFGTRFGVDYGLMMTGGVLAALIPLLLAVVFQRYIVSGLTAGAVKE